MTSTIDDDQRERHLIGSLLHGDDEIGLSSSSSSQSTQSSVGQHPKVPPASVLALGPSPNQSFWPEPPPPYSAAAPHWASLNQPGGAAYISTSSSSSLQLPQPNYAPPSSQQPQEYIYNNHPISQNSVLYAQQQQQYNSTDASTGPQSPPNMYGGSYKSSYHWESVYTPFGPVQASKRANQLPPSSKHYNYNNIDNGTLIDSTNRSNNVNTIKSYRDVASRNSSTSTGDSKPSTPNAVVSSPTIAKKSMITTMATAINQRESDIVTNGEHAKAEMKVSNSGDDSRIVEKKLANAQGEFQKITRKKGKEKGGIVTTTMSANQQPPVAVAQQTKSTKTSSSSRASNQSSASTDSTARFDVLAADRMMSPNPIKSSVMFNGYDTEQRHMGIELADTDYRNEKNSASCIDWDDEIRMRKTNNTNKKHRRDGSDPTMAPDRRRRAKKTRNTFVHVLNCILVACFTVLERFGKWLFALIMDNITQSCDIIIYASRATCNNLTAGCQRLWHQALERFRRLSVCYRQFNCWSMPWSRRKGQPHTEWGLPENMAVPTTGDEAMQRLLQCRGQDAYSILGLRSDCSDDDIKRYYKKQAVLVHPDKNQTYGADEAFKILAHAFEFIGTKEARQKYNLANLHKDPLHKEMEELWERLRQKMTEALNMMHCDCGKKHRRFIVDIRPAEARYCRKCKQRHSARDNEIWAESRFWGFVWYYYACIDGIVYDITQWAACPKNRLKHMKANSHTVQYRLISTSATVNMPMSQSLPTHKQQQQRLPTPNVKRGISGEVNVEDLLAEYLQTGRRRRDTTSSTMNTGNQPNSNSIDVDAPSQQASYRPPERRTDESRPRKAGRRRKAK